MIGVVTLLRVSVTEEYRPDPRAFPRYEPPDGLLPSQEKYVVWAGDHTDWVIRGARIRSIRFKAVALASGVLALAVTLAVAVRAPTWVPASLGFLAAVGQYVQGLSRDREQSQIAHQAAVRFQKALRDFTTDAGELSGERLRERFKEFRQTFERIKEEYGPQIFKVRGQDPPQIGGTPR
ncbi:hypothetical protein [Actinoallomurus sp. NPDC052274]|uniref:hypothetical protein n=1 Tax=Actinoallomurus sp. NPDC052274 TaxID=3155420 RepID=UPI00343A2324